MDCILINWDKLTNNDLANKLSFSLYTMEFLVRAQFSFSVHFMLYVVLYMWGRIVHHDESLNRPQNKWFCTKT